MKSETTDRHTFVPTRQLHVVVTSDDELVDQDVGHIKQLVDEWLVRGGAAIFDMNMHVAVQQPDGTWVRVCHHHPEAASDVPS